MYQAQLQAVADALVARRPKAACLALDVYIAAVKIAPSAGSAGEPVAPR